MLLQYQTKRDTSANRLANSAFKADTCSLYFSEQPVGQSVFVTLGNTQSCMHSVVWKRILVSHGMIQFPQTIHVQKHPCHVT